MLRNVAAQSHAICVSSRVRNATVTTLSTGALSAARALVSFLTVSMLLKYLGRESYGLAVTITGMASWLSLTQGGIGQTVKNEIIRQPAAAPALFSRAFATLLGIVVAAGTALTVAAYWLPWNAILNDPGFRNLPLIIASLWIVLLTALFSLVRAAYSAFQAEYKLTPALLAGLLLSFGLCVLGIHRGWSITLLISASLLANLIGLAAGLALMPRLLNLRFSKPQGLFRGGLWFFIIEACTILIFQADIFLVNLLLGQTQAAVFALHAQLFAIVQTALNLLVSPYWAAFGEAWHSGDRTWLITSVRRLALATAALSTAGVLLLLAIGRPLMTRWSHGQIEWNPALAALIGLNVILQGVTGVFATALGALGVARDPARIIIFQAILNIGVCIWLIRRFGIIGVAAGSVATYALTSGIWLPLKFKQVTA